MENYIGAINFANDKYLTWNDIWGHDKVKTQLMNIMKSLFEQDTCKTDGIILYGPPGCGKTMLGRTLSNEFRCKFIFIACSSILSQFEKNLSEIFTLAYRYKPCILFFDEIDALCSTGDDENQESQNAIWDKFLDETNAICITEDEEDQESQNTSVEQFFDEIVAHPITEYEANQASLFKITNSDQNKIVNAFLAEIDKININSNLMVIGATNYMDKIDPAIKQPGRLGRHIEVEIPQLPQQRYDILMEGTKKGTDPKFGPCDLDVNKYSIENIFKTLSEDKFTEQWNHSDLVSLVKEARSQMESDENSADCVTLKHMLASQRTTNLDRKKNYKISPEFDKFTRIIFAEQIEDKIGNYVFNEEIWAKVDFFLRLNASGITVGGRKFSGKSTLIDLIAKKYHLNLVKFDQKYFKNFDTQKFICELNKFVQKNGQSLFHVDEKRLLQDNSSPIYLASFSDSLISGSIIMYERYNENTSFFIPVFTRQQLESHFWNCLKSRFITQHEIQKFIQKYELAISNWTHFHFMCFQSFQQGYSFLTEASLIDLINTVNVEMNKFY